MVRSIAISFVLLLVGCSAVSTLPATPNHITTSLAPPPAGGPFSAGYSGTHSGSGDCLFGSTFSFGGGGSASFIHGSTESGSMGWDSGRSCAFRGRATITSTNHPSNSITVLLGPSGAPCDTRNIHGVDFQVLSGTGRFKNASGSGAIKFKCHSGGMYTDAWSGTLQF